jgi:hypothetical protein
MTVAHWLLSMMAVGVSLYFRGPNYFGDERCINEYGSNYHIHMNLNMFCDTIII